ncbi:MAG: putative lipid II flippase FtsW [Nitrospira sp.]|nr:putative lipid II flippase FtsW [Nitrospira sp.]
MASRAAGTLSLPWQTAGQRSSKQRVPIDHTVLVVTLTLALVGLVMVFSASAIMAANRFQDPEFFLKRQVAWLGLGVLLMHGMSRVDYMLWKKLAIPILICMAALLIVVLIPGVGVVTKGARRWFRAGPISVQPAEMVKLAAVIYLAYYLTKKKEKVALFGKGLLPVLIVMGLLSGLVLLQPDLGTVVVMGFVTLGLLFLGGAKVSHLAGLSLCAIPIMAALVLGSSYRRHRLMTFLAPWKDASDAGFQITQSFLAFGSGGPLGVGLGEGKQKLFFLPEAHTDFVLALVGEELGLAGTATVILLFAVFVWRGFVIAARARAPFGRFLGLGITLLIGIQALVNAAVVTGMLPTKGLTLPFVSYGGSSLIVNFVGVGILLSISRDRHAGGIKGGRGDLDHG